MIIMERMPVETGFGKDYPMDNQLERLHAILEECDRYSHMLAVISYDNETACPEGGMEEDGKDIVELSNRIYRLQKSEEYIQLVTNLHSKMDFDAFENRSIALLYKDIVNNAGITTEFRKEIDELYQKAYRFWAKARKEKDYRIFAPVLKEIASTSKKIVRLRPTYEEGNLYDTLIGDYEEGFTTKDLDSFFDDLERGIVPLLNMVRKADYVPRHDFLDRLVPIHKQEEFSHYLLKLNGFDFKRGSLSTTIHPFTSQIGKDDVRVTTHYHEDSFLSNMFTIIHEGGHALFGQNVPKECFLSHLGEKSLSMAKHESVSRFYENLIGRSESYIHAIYPYFHELFREEMADVSEKDLYEGANYVFLDNPIRMEADELTYSLHILIRYRLEKKIMNGEADMENLNKEWNRLYEDILSVSPKNDLEGILQDVHWTSGFGYFPTYAMGNALGVLYLERMKKDMDVDSLVAQGKMGDILHWMKENVFKRAPLLDTKTWIKEITGQDFSAQPYVDYLTRKFKRLYRL